MNTTPCAACGAANTTTARFCAQCGRPLTPEPDDIATPVEQPHSPPASVTQPLRESIPSIGRNRKPMSGKTRLVYGAITLGLLAVFFWMFYSHLPGQAHPVIANQPDIAMATPYAGDPIHQTAIQATVRNGMVILPLPEVLDKKIVAFDYETSSTTIPLLAYINAAGKLVTAFRMCEPCNSKTYRIEGTELCCGNCDTRWKLDNLEGIQGSCQKYPPEPIPSTVSGNEVHISEKAVQGWKMRL